MGRSNKENMNQEHPLAGFFGGMLGKAEESIKNRPEQVNTQVEQAVEGTGNKSKSTTGKGGTRAPDRVGRGKNALEKSVSGRGRYNPEN